MRSFTKADFKRQIERFRNAISTFDEHVRPGMATLTFFVDREDKVPSELFDAENWQAFCIFLFFNILEFKVEDAQLAYFVTTEEERMGATAAIEQMLEDEYPPLFAAIDLLCECAFKLQIHNTKQKHQAFAH